MGLFGSVSGKQVDEFATALARELAQRCPPPFGDDGRRGDSAKRLARALEDVFERAAGFRRLHKLGVYKKARLGNTFRWELKALGYDPKFVETVTQSLVVRISGRN
ncbi:MAG TPA: hypothetical protein VNK67_14005 [Burkholderiales bacterium]|nr:hypothetical protein [Burkholderiales bacterium]